ncbi:MAG TPA: ABC transporter substrate-binding protein [Jatrophihabitans sp.]|jgi:ABC-type nitrate/sulfonate/bicarbonate transport system substrate-binding protein
MATVAVSVVAAATAAACTSANATDHNGVTTLRYQGWTDQVILPELADALGYFKGKIKLDWVGNTISGPQDIQSAATGQTDFGGAFAGAVAKLENAGAPITAVINYYGYDDKTFTGYYVKNDSPIHDARDLIGKKIGVNTLGGQNEADIHAYLRKQGLSEADVKKVQLVELPPPNIEDALRHGQIDVASLSGQFQQHAVAVGGVRPVFTDTGLFGPFNGGPYVFRNDFIANNPDAVRAFVTGVAKAIEWERNTPRAKVIAEFTKIIDARHRANEDTSTLKYWLSVGIPSKGGVISDTDFTRWQSWLTDTGAIHGSLDAKSLYTNKFNPYATGGSS